MTPVAPTEIPQRRHTDPPWLWFSAFGGSALIHLFCLGVLSWLLVGQQAGEIGTAPIPVELIALRPESKTRKAIPPQTVTKAKVPTQKLGTRSQKFRSKGQGTGKRKQGKFPTSLKAPLLPPKHVAKAPSKRKSASPKPSPHSTAKSSPSSSKPSPHPSPKSSPSPPKPKPKPSPKPSGSGLVVTLSNVKLPNNARDIPSSRAEPKQLQQKLSPSLFPAGRNFKHRDFHVYLVIDDKGQVDLTQSRVVNPSVDAKEAQQVKSIFKDWAFQPAIQGSKPVYGELEVDLKIAPIKSK